MSGIRRIFVFVVVILIGIVAWRWFLNSEEPKVPVASKTQTDIYVYWEDKFSETEKKELQSWVTTVYGHNKNVLGSYPFPLHMYLHRVSKSNGPVPWAHTQRGKKQGVHFHVNPEIDMGKFYADWTAPHEISHLAIPFVGKENSWFAEGFASYMQYQVMKDLGIYMESEIQEKYLQKFEKCKTAYDTDIDFVSASDSLRKIWHFSDFYWGGAKFFWDVNQRLVQTKNQTINEIISDYQSTRKKSKVSLLELCTSLDSLSGTDIMVQQLLRYQTRPSREIFSDIR